MNSKQLFAGTAQVDITPPLGTRINGDFVSHYATGIHDFLYVKTLALESDGVTVVFIVVDTCYMQAGFINPLRTALATGTGLPESSFLICSTHTHSAGAVADLLLGAADMAYTQKLPDKIMACVYAALGNRRPAKIGFGLVDVPEHVLCRRYHLRNGLRGTNPVTGLDEAVVTNPFGFEEHIEKPVSEPDAGLSFLAVKGMDGGWISLMANYALHYVGDLPPGMISADYFGEFARRITEQLGAGSDFTAMMTNGTSGDVNIWDFAGKKNYPSGHFAKSRYIADDLAQKVVDVLPGITWQNEPCIRTEILDLYLPLNRPSEQDLTKAKKALSKTDLEGLKIIDKTALQNIYAREQLLLANEEEKQQLTIQAIRIGNGTIGAMAGEFFAETGLRLKRHKSSEFYFSIGLANGCVGYVPPATEFEHGGYETWRCRTCRLEPGAEEFVRTELLRILHRVNQRP